MSDVSKLRINISISLDGFVAGPNQSVENPLGEGGEQLHEWVLPLAAWREPHGKEGGETNESTQVVEENLANVGASIMGRNMFGGHPGPWSQDDPWTGWWGDEPPFHHPVFVLTHYPRERLELAGGTSFTFVTDGIGAALEQAKQAAEGTDVSVPGGANVCRQYLEAGLVDALELHQVPVLLGGGERLFDGAADYLAGLEPTRTVAAPGVTHLKFERS